MEAKRKLDKKKLINKASAAKKKKQSADASGGGSSIMDVVDQGAIVKSLGDHINTRMRDIAYEDELDEVNFEERSRTLKAEAAEALGTAQRDFTSTVGKFADRGASQQAFFIGHNRHSITCCSQLDDVVWYGDKTGAVYSYSMGKHEKNFLSPSLNAAVMSIAISDTRSARKSTGALERSTVDHSCPSYVAVGTADGQIHVWKTFSREYVGVLKLHRTSVTGLAFRVGTSTLYSCSMDSTVRVWAVAEMLAVDRLFGHLGSVLAIAAQRKERAVTAGMDRCVRYWKIEAGSQVEYAAMTGPVECVAMLNEETLIAGSAEGTLAVYDIGKMNPLCTILAAHGSGDCGDGTGLEREALATFPTQQPTAATNGAGRNGNGIYAIAAPPNSNVLATGSHDGFVRLWQFVPRVAQSGKEPVPARLAPIGSVKIEGVISGLHFSPDATRLVVVSAKEQRLGRWITKGDVLNGVHVLSVKHGAKGSAPPSAATVSGNAQLFAPRSTVVRNAKPAAAMHDAFDDEETEDVAMAQNSDDGEYSDNMNSDGGDNLDIEEEENLFELGDHGQLVFKGAAAASSSGEKGGERRTKLMKKKKGDVDVSAKRTKGNKKQAAVPMKKKKSLVRPKGVGAKRARK